MSLAPTEVGLLSMTKALLGLPRLAKRVLALSLDAILCAASVYLAFYLRLGEWVDPRDEMWVTMLTSLAIAMPIFIVIGLYRAIFRYAGWQAIVAILRATMAYAVVFATIYTLIGVPGTPRTIGIIQPILLFMLVGSSRMVARGLFEEGYTAIWRSNPAERVLIYGAGTAGRELAGTLSSSKHMRLIGFVDDNPALAGATLQGVSIYPPTKLKAIVERYNVQGVLLALPSASGTRRAEIVTVLKKLGLHVRTLPSMGDIARGKIAVSDLKELEIGDLLGRAPVAPDRALIGRMIGDRNVLVTGAGGSIGSELCRQIVQSNPKRLILLDHSEYNLYRIHRELQNVAGREGQALELVPVLASVCDTIRMRRVFEALDIDTVYHAAAYKHVPLVEHNLGEGVRNNVIGTSVTAELAGRHAVRDFVLISTDKAVRPTNVMGASKRCAEMVVQALDQQPFKTRYSMVRFGNVLGSSGSVVPLFREQVEAGGPITVTHQDITRYFMSIPEAAQLVLQAGAMAGGGDVFVLDMGDPIRIIDLARSIVELSGRTVRDDANPEGDIEIRIDGLRPGEKLYEELLIGGETIATEHDRILRSREEFLPFVELLRHLADLTSAIEEGDAQRTREKLREIVPEFVPNSPIVDVLASEGAGGTETDNLIRWNRT